MHIRTLILIAAATAVLALPAAGAESTAGNDAPAAPTAATATQDECEEPAYRHDHRQQKGMPSSRPDCKVTPAEDDADSVATAKGHDHREQHKQH